MKGAMDVKDSEKNDITPMTSGGIFHQEVAGMRTEAKASNTREPYGPPGFRGLFTNHYVAMCAAFATLGGLLFGYEYASSTYTHQTNSWMLMSV